MKTISIDELKKMTDSEGLILQGCGGDAQEWVGGINELFTEEQILRNGDTFKNISAFEHGGLSNLLFHMDGVDLNVGKLAVWRIATHDTYGGIRRDTTSAIPPQSLKRHSASSPQPASEARIFRRQWRKISTI